MYVTHKDVHDDKVLKLYLHFRRICTSLNNYSNKNTSAKISPMKYPKYENEIFDLMMKETAMALCLFSSFVYFLNSFPLITT